MDRRDFFAGLGAIVAGSAGAHTPMTHRGESIAPLGFQVNGSPLGITRIDAGSTAAALSLGYLPGSAEYLLAQQATETDAPGFRNLFAPLHSDAQISILGVKPSAVQSIQRIDLTVQFSLPEPPYYAPFYAWQYVRLPGLMPRGSAPVLFKTRVPESAVVTIGFQVQNPLSGALASGALHYSLGGAGLGPGIYVMAGPSAATGAAPAWTDVTWGDAPGILVRRDGQAIDFDYVTMALAPASA